MAVVTADSSVGLVSPELDGRAAGFGGGTKALVLESSEGAG